MSQGWNRAGLFTLLSFGAVLGSLGPAASARAATYSPWAVYGSDHRKELYEVRRPEIREIAHSTVAIFDAADLIYKGDHYAMNPATAVESVGLCPEERFSNQPAAANCSGTLIARDLVLTAGHCIASESCGTTLFAFGYAYKSQNDASIGSFPPSEVYACKQVLLRKNEDDVDYAVVRLDREVTGHRPAAISSEEPESGDSVFMLGHPTGLPLKFTGDAVVTKSHHDHFTARIDALGGNSGAGVFDSKTRALVGILVNGEDDYVTDTQRQCLKVNICKPNACEGEDSTQVAVVLRAMKKAGIDIRDEDLQFASRN